VRIYVSRRPGARDTAEKPFKRESGWWIISWKHPGKSIRAFRQKNISG
jgi:hypothetical protein